MCKCRIHLNSLQDNKNLSEEREREREKALQYAWSWITHSFFICFVKTLINFYDECDSFGWHLIWIALKIIENEIFEMWLRRERGTRQAKLNKNYIVFFFILFTFVTANLLHIKRTRDIVIAQIHSIELHLGATSFSKLFYPFSIGQAIFSSTQCQTPFP